MIAGITPRELFICACALGALCVGAATYRDAIDAYSAIVLVFAFTGAGMLAK